MAVGRGSFVGGNFSGVSGLSLILCKPQPGAPHRKMEWINHLLF